MRDKGVTEKLSLQVDRQASEVYRVKGDFHVAKPAAEVWRRLKAFKPLGSLVPGVKGLKVSLRLRHQPGERKILFEDVLRKDFRHYDGNWRVIALPNGSKVHYELLAHGQKGTGTSLGPLRAAKGLRGLLEQLRREIQKALRQAPRSNP